MSSISLISPNKIYLRFVLIFFKLSYIIRLLDALFSFSSEYIIIINKSYKRPSGNYSLSSSSPSKLMKCSATDISGNVNSGSNGSSRSSSSSSSSNKGSISSIDEEIQLLMNSRSELLFHYSFLLIHTILSQIILYINTTSPSPISSSSSSSSIYDDINDENSQSYSRNEAFSRLKEVSNKFYDYDDDDNDDGSDNDNDNDDDNNKNYDNTM